MGAMPRRLGLTPTDGMQPKAAMPHHLARLIHAMRRPRVMPCRASLILCWNCCGSWKDCCGYGPTIRGSRNGHHRRDCHRLDSRMIVHHRLVRLRLRVLRLLPRARRAQRLHSIRRKSLRLIVR